MTGRVSGAIELVVLASLMATPASGLQVLVKNADGGPVENAVVYATALNGNSPATTRAPQVDIDQVGKEYVPHVTAIQVGTAVRFPNKDQIRHNVYSLSKPMTFEIKLYKGLPPDPTVFDQPGVVVLGCNIHDWMRAYVFVAETPHFAVTDEAGRAKLTGLRAQDYEVEVWHPEIKAEPDSRTVKGDVPELIFEVELRKTWRPRHAPNSQRSGPR
jgi:plastocyanin